MKNLQEYVVEAVGGKIKLPYTFDIYNSGPKNLNHKITKINIYKIYMNLANDNKYGYDSMIKLPLAPNDITYAERINKDNTDNWTKLPEIKDYMYAGGYYSEKRVEYNYNDYNRDWDKWLNSLKPYMSGKISVTIRKDDNNKRDLVIEVNNTKFNKERKEKISNLKDLKNLEPYIEEERRYKEEIRQKEIADKKAKEAHDRWWKSLSDDEQMSWAMGYGRGRGNWTGD